MRARSSFSTNSPIIRDSRLMDAIHNHPRRHRITVEEYMRMREAHVFEHDARIELIEGELVEMAAISSAHESVVNTLAALLHAVVQRSRAGMRK